MALVLKHTEYDRRIASSVARARSRRVRAWSPLDRVRTPRERSPADRACFSSPFSTISIAVVSLPSRIPSPMSVGRRTTTLAHARRPPRPLGTPLLAVRLCGIAARRTWRVALRAHTAGCAGAATAGALAAATGTPDAGATAPAGAAAGTAESPICAGAYTALAALAKGSVWV